MDQLILKDLVHDSLADHVESITDYNDCLEIEVTSANLLTVSTMLRDIEALRFDCLVDLCAVDYSDYGKSYWRDKSVDAGGYDRGVVEGEAAREVYPWEKPRFAVIYHIRSVCHNRLIRMVVYLPVDPPLLPSVTGIWPVANWFEREAFDLFGVIFDGHEDLRRILTDYGFIGHPFRKDFPLIGHLELRYDAAEERCVYEPVSIKPRITVPKVIREDTRYMPGNQSCRKGFEEKK